MQDKKDIEDWYAENPDPWDYEKNSDDLKRKKTLLEALPKHKFNKVLDIGCGNGFITQSLPGNQIYGVDISTNAIEHARKKIDNENITFFEGNLFDLNTKFKNEKFDLIIITGVLYKQYIGKSSILIYHIINELLSSGGIFVHVHINDWYKLQFPFFKIQRLEYSYRQYTHVLEVYEK